MSLNFTVRSQVMKLALQYFALILIGLSGCRSAIQNRESDTIAKFPSDWLSPGTLVTADKTNATQTLVLWISVDNFIDGMKTNKTEWHYRKLEKREKDDGRYKHAKRLYDTSSFIAGGNPTFSLSIHPDTAAVLSSETNIHFDIKYGVPRDGIWEEIPAIINVPIYGTATGRIDELTYRAEWRPNQASEAIAPQGGAQPQR